MAASTTDNLKTQAHELVKQFVIYDGNNRITSVYTAPAAAVDGTPCTLVTYAYLTPTSSLVEKMREANSTWSSAYDI